jgi:ABC-type glycerol-3-phosphate transport system substrate-binding protein
MNFNVSALPTQIEGGSVVQAGGWMLSVNKDAQPDMKKLAWDMIKTFTDRQVEFALVDKSLVTRKDLIGDPRLKELSPQYHSFSDVYAGTGTTRPKTTLWRELVSAVEPLNEQFLLGELTVEQISKKANEAVAKVIAEAKADGKKL